MQVLRVIAIDRIPHAGAEQAEDGQQGHPQAEAQPRRRLRMLAQTTEQAGNGRAVDGAVGVSGGHANL